MSKSPGLYGDEKEASAEIDRELGFEIDRTEVAIRDRLKRSGINHETWAHLSPQVFQTPYAELERIVQSVDLGPRFQRWVDVGAAYGRLGIVLTRLRPEAHFLGLELVPERVSEGQRIYKQLGIEPARLACVDINESPLPAAEFYFIYDFGHRSAIDALLEKLKAQARLAPITVVGRGRAIRDAIEHEHPWLSSVHSPRHEAHYSVYAS